jgi:hypothetical protein
MRLAGSLAVVLAFLGAVDTAETDAFRMVTVQNFDGVTVKDGDDFSGVVGSGVGSWAQREHNNARTVDQPEERLCPG